jgi:radical SAM superfamily enzyme YgiQ (UPF0313 family)
MSMNVVLISTYELGHQPFGLASPAAWLRARGAVVTCLDLSREALRPELILEADLVAFYVPMHTATRLAAQLVAPVRELNPRAHLCFYCLYAPVNEEYLRSLGVETIIGGEFEEKLARLVDHLAERGQAQNDDQDAAWQNAARLYAAEPVISLDRLNFLVPDRSGLPPLREYAHLLMPDGERRVAGYTEASRGCKHLCRHCPIVPVYNGVFRIVPREIVLEDIRRQVDAGAEHIAFGDPDFFNGPAHALSIVEALHREFPGITYDVIIKIEHLLRSPAEDLVKLRDTGCLFVTSAVESLDDAVLARLDKGHTRADFLAVVRRFRALGLLLQPTFVPFTPWTTLESHRDLLEVIAAQNLIENVAPIQLGIRLLIPAGSRLLELREVRDLVDPFEPSALVYPWRHVDPRMDALASRVQALAAEGDKLRRSRSDTFALIWRAACARPQPPSLTAPAAIPHFSEPWYCCAEPTQEQFIYLAAPHQPAVPELDALEPAADAAVAEADGEVAVDRDVDVFP